MHAGEYTDPVVKATVDLNIPALHNHTLFLSVIKKIISLHCITKTKKRG
jgi:hypothetical protein